MVVANSTTVRADRVNAVIVNFALRECPERGVMEVSIHANVSSRYKNNKIMSR